MSALIVERLKFYNQFSDLVGHRNHLRRLGHYKFTAAAAHPAGYWFQVS
ncbi:hypothetical protein COO91_10796 (plasmid) [Nostoc flagelliforme CCNUN1]|uniref:Uncharacterized protein n=1 Tax=Nostoc flagelliforme CCNUN1 TaxID=2038116 RepID=A0A2K8TA63_9NOSO|nr:hypothetical protein [Nostoc flagelliforme]AUB44560.1 hypothetical protein COO91_10796 [Nostoc flagelliforme CCNUN1]